MDETVAEQIRRGYEAMNRGDFDAALADADPEIEWHDPPEFPDRRPPFRGREALKKVWMEYFEAFDNLVFETGELRQSGDRTFVELSLSGTGKSSGAPVEMTWYQVGTLNPEGRATRLENYLDRDRALKAAGLDQS